MKHIARLLAALALALGLHAFGAEPKTNPQVRLTTNVGVIELELYPDKAPETVKNFLQYVDARHYDGTIFHRVIPNFMIQGGGFTSMTQGASFEMNQKPTRAPIKNEANNGLKNLPGTIAMARTSDPHSASAQFFINTADNDPLNFRGESVSGWGYAVFGKVTKGMDIVRKIEATPTRNVHVFQDVPAKEIVIVNAERISKGK
jgi:cyclophilin family peptidyl-prolyl cis-trans isomerase